MKAELKMPGSVGYADTDVSGMARVKKVFTSDDFVGDLYIQVSDQVDLDRFNWVTVGRVRSGQVVTEIDASARYMRISPASVFNSLSPPTVWVSAEAGTNTFAFIDTPFNPGVSEGTMTGDPLDTSAHGPVKTIKCAEHVDEQGQFKGDLFIEGLVSGIPESLARFNSQGIAVVRGLYDQMRVKRRRPFDGQLTTQPVVSIASTTEGGGTGGGGEEEAAAPSLLTFSRTIAVVGGSFTAVLLGSVTNIGGLPLPACRLQNLRARIRTTLGSEDGIVMTVQNVSRFPVPYIQMEWAPAGSYGDLGVMIAPNNVPVNFSVNELVQIAISGGGMSTDGNLHIDGSVEVVAPTEEP